MIYKTEFKFHLNGCQSLTENVRRSRLGPNFESLSTQNSKEDRPEGRLVFIDERVGVIDDFIGVLI
jgi:hypothetical protein